jgi:hypothetical protein
MIISIVIVITLIVAAISVMSGAFSTLPGATNINESEANYLIFKSDAGLTCARNGHTNVIDYAGSNASNVFNQAMNAGGVRTEKVTITARGSFDLVSAITVPSYTYLDLSGARLTRAHDNISWRDFRWPEFGLSFILYFREWYIDRGWFRHLQKYHHSRCECRKCIWYCHPT